MVPSRPLMAYIFDMDSLLADTGAIWREAEDRLLRQLGDAWSPHWAERYRGLNAADLAAVVHEHLRPSQSLEWCRQFMHRALREAYKSGELTAMPGAVELVGRLRGRAPMAVASGSPRGGIETATRRLGIRECFEVVISSESVGRGKPAPDVFGVAAERLGVAPDRCIVFEDSVVGVRAALAAGMTCFAVPSGRGEEIARLTPHVFPSLAEIGDAELALE